MKLKSHQRGETTQRYGVNARIHSEGASNYKPPSTYIIVVTFQTLLNNKVLPQLYIYYCKPILSTVSYFSGCVFTAFTGSRLLFATTTTESECITRLTSHITHLVLDKRDRLKSKTHSPCCGINAIGCIQTRNGAAGKRCGIK